MVVLIDLKDKVDNNLFFLQELRCATTPTPQPITKFAPFDVPSSSKPSQF
jgi:hypothetical protein